MSVSAVRLVPCTGDPGNVCGSYGYFSGNPRWTGLSLVFHSGCGGAWDLVVHTNWMVFGRLGRACLSKNRRDEKKNKDTDIRKAKLVHIFQFFSVLRNKGGQSGCTLALD